MFTAIGCLLVTGHLRPGDVHRPEGLLVEPPRGIWQPGETKGCKGPGRHRCRREAASGTNGQCQLRPLPAHVTCCEPHSGTASAWPCRSPRPYLMVHLDTCLGLSRTKTTWGARGLGRGCCADTNCTAPSISCTSARDTAPDTLSPVLSFTGGPGAIPGVQLPSPHSGCCRGTAGLGHSGQGLKEW